MKNVHGIRRRCDDGHALKCQWSDKRAKVCVRRAQAGPVSDTDSFHVELLSRVDSENAQRLSIDQRAMQLPLKL